MFLSGKVNRTVPIETAAGTRRATLRRREADANQKLYYFELGAPPGTEDAQPAQGATSAGAGDPATPDGDGPAQAPVAAVAADGGPAPTGSATGLVRRGPDRQQHPSGRGRPGMGLSVNLGGESEPRVNL